MSTRVKRQLKQFLSIISGHLIIKKMSFFKMIPKPSKFDGEGF